MDSEEGIISESECYSLSIMIITYDKYLVSKEFINLRYTQMQETVQIFLILYSIKEIEGRLDYGDNFLVHVLGERNLIHGPYCPRNETRPLR